MITVRAAIITILCFVIAVGTRCSCCKCDEVDLKYTSTFRELQLTSIDNSGKEAIPAVNNTAPKNAYGVKLELISTTGMIANMPCRSFSLFIADARAAMDCFCNTSQAYVPTDSIRAITITDLEPFDNIVPANADITSRFRYYDRYQRRYFKINDLFDDRRQGLFYPSYYAEKDAVPGGELRSAVTFLLMEPPAAAGVHRFKISVLLKSGLKIEQTTSPTTLQ